LDQGAAANLEVGEHTQLFQRRHGQVLRLVDDQQGPPPRALIPLQLQLDRVEKPGLFHLMGVDAEPLGDEAQHVVALDLGGDEADRIETLPVDAGHEMADQGRLARADLAGHDDEALALGEAVAEIGHGLPVRATVEPEARVGGQLKRLPVQAVMIGVHMTLPRARPLEGVAEAGRRRARA